MRQPKITVITPSFNQADYLEEALCSVMSQDYSAIEYIVLDGGSTDASPEIIKKYTSQLTYWRSAPDSGQTAAINEGMHLAKGDIVGWLNSDDVLMPGVLKAVAQAFVENEKVGLVTGKMLVIDEAGNVIGERYNHGKLDRGAFLNGQSKVNQPGAFFRRSCLVQVGYLDESLNYAMDYDLWIKLLNVSKGMELDVPLAQHRMHGLSKTCKEFEKFIPEIKLIRQRNGGDVFCRKTFDLLRCELGLARRKLFRG